MNWYRSVDSGAVTHYCKGIETNEEVIDNAKKGIYGTIKPKGTNTEGTMWFHPALPVKEEDSISGYKCAACGTTSPKDVSFVNMGG